MGGKYLSACGLVVWTAIFSSACGSSSSDGATGPGTADGGTEGGVVVGNPVTLTLGATNARVWQGRTSPLKVTVDRTGTPTPVDVTLDGLPAGVVAKPVQIPADQSSVDVELTVDPDPVKSTVGTTKGVIARGRSGDVTSTATFDLRLTGAPGSFDTTFGPAGGKGRVDVASLFAGDEVVEPIDIVVEPNGAFEVLYDVALGTPAGHHEFAVLRLGADGAIDAAWGNKGVLRAQLDQSFPYAMVRLSDGKLMVVGNCQIGGSYRVMLARVLTDGTLDLNFGGTPKAGVVALPSIDNGAVPTDEARAAVTFTTGGQERIAIAGASGNNGLEMQVTTAGALDTSYKTTGYTVSPVGAANNKYSSRALALAPDQTRYVIHERLPGTAQHDVQLFSFTPAGDPNLGVNNAGFFTIGSTSASIAERIAMLPDGRLLTLYIGGTTDSPNPSLGRYAANGTYDTAYKPQLSPGTRTGLFPSSLTAMADGRVIAAIHFWQTSATGMLLYRVLPDGTLDPFYGTSGASELIYVGGTIVATNSVSAVLPDGRVIFGALDYLARAWD